jgi:hypothetical protein
MRSPSQNEGKAVSTSGTKAIVHQRGTVTTVRTPNTGVDDDERQALRDEGLDPDDPAVIAAIDLVRWELSLGKSPHPPDRSPRTCPGHRVDHEMADPKAAARRGTRLRFELPNGTAWATTRRSPFPHSRQPASDELRPWLKLTGRPTLPACLMSRRRAAAVRTK